MREENKEEYTGVGGRGEGIKGVWRCVDASSWPVVFIVGSSLYLYNTRKLFLLFYGCVGFVFDRLRGPIAACDDGDSPRQKNR